MKVHVANHPLISHKLTVLRDERTDSPTFRHLVEELVTLLAYEATRDVQTVKVKIKTPVTETEGLKMASPRPIVVPILRAGLGMLEGMSRLVPNAEVGFLGMVRDEKTLQASTYANRLPDDLSGRHCFVLDPMLATGGTLVAALNYLIERGATEITAICILAAPEGIATMEKAFANTKIPITVVTGALDENPCKVGAMKVHVANHPLISHKLTVLRDERTDSPTFRHLVEELVTLLAYEATRDVQTVKVKIKTPVTETEGLKMATPRPIVVPILRAGLGMLEGMSRLVPNAEVGFLGMVRDEKTLQASTYANRLPDDLSGRHCFVLDPMLATGGTLVAALNYLIERGATEITAICILAAPEGIATMEKAFANTKIPITVVTGALDEKLNEHGYIVPGLGDAGDRLYGVV